MIHIINMESKQHNNFIDININNKKNNNMTNTYKNDNITKKYYKHNTSNSHK